MGRRKAGDELDVEKLIRMVEEGASIAQIAAALAVTERTVSRYKQALGLTQCSTGYRKLPSDWKERAQALFDEGYSQAGVAEVVGVSVDAVARHFPGRGWTHSQRGVYARQAKILLHLAA